jgi:uncharacterized protein (DUF1499 family)
MSLAIKRTVYQFGIIVCAALIALFFLACTASAPKTGIFNGKLKPCPNRPNCVSSEVKDISPWLPPLRFKESPKRAWKKLNRILQQMDAKIIKDQDGYLWATFTSTTFRFVDDVEFRMVTEKKVIHMRSASRTGYWDMGVNRKRVEEIRQRFDPKTLKTIK